MADTVTDISDKSWDDLDGADHSIKRELAAERDGVDGNAAGEQIVAELLAFEGRADEVPDEYQHYLNDDEGADDAREETADTDTADEGDTDDDEAEDADDEDEDTSFTPASDYEPERDSRFIIDAGRLQAWLDHVGTLVDEAKVHLDPDEVRVTAVDAANVAMVDTPLFSRAFESYSVTEPGVIGVNTNRFADVVKGANAGDLVSLGYDSQVRNLVITHGGHEFTLALIDPASIRKEPDLPELDLPARVEIDGRTLDTALKYADSVSDHVRFEARPGDGAAEATFRIYAEGDTDSYEWAADAGDDDLTFVSYPDEQVSSMFSLDYLTDIKPAIPADATVTIDLGQEFPLRLELDIEDDEDEPRAVGEATYMLAPRITSD